MSKKEGKSNSTLICQSNSITSIQNHHQIPQLATMNQENAQKEKRFKTDTEPFNKLYQKWDAVQNQMHQEPIERFIELIIQKYLQEKTPLSIVDLGCGYGKQAHYIKKKLEENGVEIQKFYGYDISDDLIQIAKEKYGSEPKMGYFKKNLETQFKDQEEFDVAISFCALHWVNDIKTTTEAIYRSLKPKGILLALIGLDIQDLHELRVKFINTSKWSKYFREDQRTVSHFQFNTDKYRQAFQHFFTTKSQYQRVAYSKTSHEETVDFMGNWLQEVRQITKDIKEEKNREAIIRNYASDLIHSFPLGMDKNIIKNEDGSVLFNHIHYQYEGIKK